MKSFEILKLRRMNLFIHSKCHLITKNSHPVTKAIPQPTNRYDIDLSGLNLIMWMGMIENYIKVQD